MSRASLVTCSPVPDAQPADVRALRRSVRDKLWVSMVLVDGKWVGVSRYGDPSWRLTSKARNTPRSGLHIDFNLVPAEFRQIAKATLYRYLRRGLERGKRPVAKSAVRVFHTILPFFRFLSARGISRLAKVDELACKQYCDFSMVESRRAPGVSRGEPLKRGTLVMRFRAVEQLHELSEFTDDAMAVHPWPGSSASHIAAPSALIAVKTQLVPDEHFTKLFQAASSDVERGEEVVRLRDELDVLDVRLSGLSGTVIRKHKNRYLLTQRWHGGLKALNDAVIDIRTACYVVVASLTGCRMHELASVESGSCYSTQGNDGETYLWMRGHSAKTDEGRTEWMIPTAGVAALRLMDTWAKPYQALIRVEIERRRAENPGDPMIAEAFAHQNALFLGAAASRPDLVRTISASTWNNNINQYARKHGIQWVFASHQFRRKFANYVAHSRFGDLRYLKEHFKHWSMDMTLGYALNESQEMSLYIEIQEELDEVKRGIVRNWVDPKEPLVGGYGSNIVAWRGSNDITIFRDRKTMIAAIAESTAIRSNGHAWCTADDDLCVGNDMERTRCTECNNAVIGRVHAHIYQGMYNQLKQTLTCDDIGPGGIRRIKRDLARCRQTLIRLGYDPETAPHEN